MTGEFQCLGLYLSVGPTADAIEDGTGDARNAWSVSLDWLTADELLAIAREIAEADQRGESIGAVLCTWLVLRGDRQ